MCPKDTGGFTRYPRLRPRNRAIGSPYDQRGHRRAIYGIVTAHVIRQRSKPGTGERKSRKQAESPTSGGCGSRALDASCRSVAERSRSPCFSGSRPR